MQRTLGKLRRGEHVTLVALGDSNTEQTFHTQGRLNWVGLLSDAIFLRHGAGVCTMINSGKCASSFDEAQSRIERDVLRFKPDLVITALGLNDAGRGVGALPAFRDLVKRTITRIREEANCEVLVRTFNPIVAVNGVPLPPGVRPGDVIERAGGSDRLHARAIVEIAHELSVPCVDHYTLWRDAQFAPHSAVANPNGLWMRMSDAVHPNAVGHLVFYRELATVFGLDPRFPWEG